VVVAYAVARLREVRLNLDLEGVTVRVKKVEGRAGFPLICFKASDLLRQHRPNRRCQLVIKRRGGDGESDRVVAVVRVVWGGVGRSALHVKQNFKTFVTEYSI
jgi:hypothetical protein